jgi:hypothetical protein
MFFSRMCIRDSLIWPFQKQAPYYYHSLEIAADGPRVLVILGLFASESVHHGLEVRTRLKRAEFGIGGHDLR